MLAPFFNLVNFNFLIDNLGFSFNTDSLNVRLRMYGILNKIKFLIKTKD